MIDQNVVAEADGDVRYVRGTLGLSLSVMAHESRYWWASTILKPKNKAILDFGCGSGYGAGYLAGQGARVTGWDISSTAIAFAAQQHPNCTFDMLDLTADDVPEDAQRAFNAVVSFDVIEHVEKWWSFLKNIRTALSDDGIALVGCPNRLVTFDYNPAWNVHHLQEFTPLQLFHILSKQFSTVEIWAQDFVSDELRRQYHVRPEAALSRLKKVAKAVIPARVISRVGYARARRAAVISEDFSWSDYMSFYPIDLSRKEAMRQPFGLVSICRP